MMEKTSFGCRSESSILYAYLSAHLLPRFIFIPQKYSGSSVTFIFSNSMRAHPLVRALRYIGTNLHTTSKVTIILKPAICRRMQSAIATRIYHHATTMLPTCHNHTTTMPPLCHHTSTSTVSHSVVYALSNTRSNFGSSNVFENTNTGANM